VDAIPRRGIESLLSMSLSNVQSQPLPTDAGDDADDIILIEPAHGWVSLGLRELWQYRELLYFLTWRDIKVRYKQTLLGASWAILQPVFTMIVMSIFFGRLAKMPSDGMPYPIFNYTALLPWTFFAGGLSRAAGSVVGSAGLIKKVYFPRLVVPISGVLAGIPDFLLSFVVLFGMMIYYDIYPTAASIIWLPLFLLLAGVTALGVGLWFAALNAEYRDIRYLITFITQFWMYATPVVYPASLLNDPWKTLYGLNPMVGVVEGFRWTLLGKGSSPSPMVAVSAVVAVLLLIGGAYYFRRMEKTFADVV
jgi:lipopolysaccharide transport system permease protein